MKVVFYNVYDLTIDGEGLAEYLVGLKDSVDVFCFQEARESTQNLCKKLFPERKSVVLGKVTSTNDQFSQGTYISPHLDFKTVRVVAEYKMDLGLAIHTEVISENGTLHLVNVHGLPYPGLCHKMDTPERLEHSKQIIDYLAKLEGPKVIGGDFNLLPETESVKMFERAGYLDLIKDFGIKTTRNKVALSKYPGTEMYFCDYVFVSPDVQVSTFDVPYNEHSDHLPLVLDILL